MTNILFELNRPEYPNNPEGLQSFLAWSLIEKHERSPSGLIYESRSIKQGGPQQTRPIPEEFEVFRSIMEFSDAFQNNTLLDSLFDNMQAVIPAKAKGIAVTPVTFHVALLQDAKGIHSKKNPPAIDRIINQIYSAGGGEQDGTCASRIWYEAINNLNDQLFFVRLDQAVRSHLATHNLQPDVNPDLSPEADSINIPSWFKNSKTPFHWFFKNWKIFCEGEWRNVLPNRRWSDWATCILRTGVSMSFLWEAKFYRSLARIALDETVLEDHASNVLQVELNTLLHWEDPNESLSIRDSNSAIRQMVIDGTFIRDWIKRNIGSICEEEELEDRYKNSDAGLKNLVIDIRNFLGVNQGARLDLLQGLGSKKPVLGSNNTIETITYLLTSRQPLGDEADFYGFLRRRSRRFLVPEPGAEWMVVIASLTARKVGGKTTLGDVRNSLRELGILASRSNVVTELERCGLTRSSHDADDAIIVESAF